MIEDKNPKYQKTAINICVSLLYMLFDCPKVNFGPLPKGQFLINVLLTIFDSSVNNLRCCSVPEIASGMTSFSFCCRLISVL